MTRYDMADAMRNVITEQREEITTLKAENAKLLDEMIDAYNDKVVAQLEADELRAEIAQLRKLVLELYEDQCDECDQWKYRDRMAQLGVGVDE